MPKFDDQLDSIYASDRGGWRQWLTLNHQEAIGIWLIYYKVGSGKPSVRYSDAVKEALCFGWIDSKVQTLDTESYRQIFTPRKPKSVWSKLNKQYLEELTAQGLMTATGLEKIVTAKQDGSWYSLDEIEALIIPPDLQQAFELSPIAQQNFTDFNKSTKKNILFWISSAKRPTTRLQRIEQTIQSALNNVSVIIYSPQIYGHV